MPSRDSGFRRNGRCGVKDKAAHPDEGRDVAQQPRKCRHQRSLVSPADEDGFDSVFAGEGALAKRVWLFERNHP